LVVVFTALVELARAGSVVVRHQDERGTDKSGRLNLDDLDSSSFSERRSVPLSTLPNSSKAESERFA
jgi:hypothetical protein